MARLKGQSSCLCSLAVRLQACTITGVNLAFYEDAGNPNSAFMLEQQALYPQTQIVQLSNKKSVDVKVGVSMSKGCMPLQQATETLPV